MRIGVNAVLAYPELRGVGIHIFHLLEGIIEQQREGLEVVVFVPPWLANAFPEDNIISYVVVNPPKSRVLRNLWLLLVFPVVSSRYSLDLLHTPDTSPLFPMRIPQVVTIHDVGEFESGSKYGRFQGFARRMISRAAAKIATIVITVSNTSKDKIVHHLNVPGEKVQVVHNGVTVARVETGDAQRVRQEYSLPEHFVLYVGEIERTKNVDCLLQAYQLLPSELRAQLKVVLVGKAGNAIEDVQRIKPSLGDALVMLGYVPKEHIAAIYAAADIFVFPSYLEGFGLPVLEAMAAGIPVIAANATSLPEVCGDAALMFDPQSPDDLAEKIGRVYLSESLRDTLVRRGKERVLEFSWAKMGKTTIDIYRDVVRDNN